MAFTPKELDEQNRALREHMLQFEKLAREHFLMLATLKQTASVLADVTDELKKDSQPDTLRHFMEVRTRVVEDIKAIDPVYFGLKPPIQEPTSWSDNN